MDDKTLIVRKKDMKCITSLWMKSVINGETGTGWTHPLPDTVSRQFPVVLKPDETFSFCLPEDQELLKDKEIIEFVFELSIWDKLLLS